MFMPTVHPMLDSDAVLLCQIPGMRAELLRRLLDRWGSATAILRAPSAELRSAGTSPALVARIVAAPRQQAATEASLRSLERMGITTLPFPAPDYPQMLRGNPDPPLVLYSQGRWPLPEPIVVFVAGEELHGEFRERVTALLQTLAECGIVVATISDLALLPTVNALAVLPFGLLLARSRVPEVLLMQAASGAATILSVTPVNAPPTPVWEEAARQALLALAAGVIIAGTLPEPLALRPAACRWFLRSEIPAGTKRSPSIIDGGENGAKTIARALGIRSLGLTTVQQGRLW